MVKYSFQMVMVKYSFKSGVVNTSGNRVVNTA